MLNENPEKVKYDIFLTFWIFLKTTSLIIAFEVETYFCACRKAIKGKNPNTVSAPKFTRILTITDYVNATYPGERLRVTIALKRKIMSDMMTTFFPSLLLLMITYATTFFKPFFFEAALSVNLATMLVMTTVFISKMEGLSATKMIKYWLILCQLVPFAQVVLPVRVLYLPTNTFTASQFDQKSWSI